MGGEIDVDHLNPRRIRRSAPSRPEKTRPDKLTEGPGFIVGQACSLIDGNGHFPQRFECPCIVESLIHFVTDLHVGWRRKDGGPGGGDDATKKVPRGCNEAVETTWLRQVPRLSPWQDEVERLNCLQSGLDGGPPVLAGKEGGSP